MLRTSIPVPTSRSTESATCATTSILPSPNLPVPRSALETPRPCARSAVRELDARRTQRGDEAEEDCGGEREQSGEGEHAAIEARRQLRAARERDERGAPPHREEDAERAAGDREDQALGEELLDEPHPVGAECHAHAHLATARRRTREHEVGEIRADDEQHDAHRGHEDVERVLEQVTVVGKAARPRLDQERLLAETVLDRCAVRRWRVIEE